jgi:hypothetical protein
MSEVVSETVTETASELERIETQILKQLDDQNAELDRLFDIVESKRMFDDDDALFKYVEIEDLEFENPEAKDKIYHSYINYITASNQHNYVGANTPMDNKTYVQTIAVHENTRNTLAQLHNFYKLINNTVLDNEHNSPLLAKIKTDMERIDEAIAGVNALLEAIKYKNKLDNMVCDYANRFNINLNDFDKEEPSEQVQSEPVQSE